MGLAHGEGKGDTNVSDTLVFNFIGFGNYIESGGIIGTLSASGGDINGGGCLVLENMTYQDKTGCLTQGAHPGSYNGQDAYNDMLITEGGVEVWIIGNGQIDQLYLHSKAGTLNCMHDQQILLIANTEREG